MIRKKCDEKATLTTRQRLRQTLTATKLQQFFETNPFIIKKNAAKCAKTFFSSLLFVYSKGLCIFAAAKTERGFEGYGCKSRNER